LIVPPFIGGIGKAVLGGALATGVFVVVWFVGSLLLLAATTQAKATNTKVLNFNLLNIFLQIISCRRRLVWIARQRFARHSIFTFNPVAEVNELATFRTEWTKGVIFPLGWFPAGWTLHES
jgi:hypothetical protein